MKFLSLIVWVAQLGFSVLFPVSSFMLLAFWLRNNYGWGLWIFLPMGVVGLLTSYSSAKSCIRAILKEVERLSDKKPPSISFNDHE